MRFNKKSLIIGLKTLAVSLVLGIAGGIIGALFSWLIGLVTKIRTDNGWIICILPIAAPIIVLIYKKLGVSEMGTNRVLESADGKNTLSTRLLPAVFTTSVISHLLGASVGREGAALQMGGSLATFFSKIFHLSDVQRKILVRAGMAAVFAAVFGTPLAAFWFALEIVCVGNLHLKSALFCLISSFSGYFTALLLGTQPERFTLYSVPVFSFSLCVKIFIMTVATAILSICFCGALHYFSKFVKQILKNEYLRIFSGGILIFGLTVIVGNQNYNGAGINIIDQIFKNNQFEPYSFALKLIFTCISVAFGFKGGEIVPTLFIGSTFGAFLASILGVPVSFGAALCMILLFCGVTNCPLASVFLSFELFSGTAFKYFIIPVILCFLLSGKISLYSAQKHKFKL